MEHGYPAAIEYRFSGTTNVTISNNLTNKSISDQEGATGTEDTNITNASGTWFVNPAAGDLHLNGNISQVVDQGRTINGLSSDFDGDARPQGTAFDIGADEMSSIVTVRPMPPSDLSLQ
jgi:hypothetical protein